MAIENTSLTALEIDKIFTKCKRIFFIGIGGVSLSSLARLCVKEGKTVFGYDAKRNEFSASLEGSCHIKYCSSPDSVEGMDLVVFTTAIDESNFEYARAKKLNIPLISRANFLGYLMTKYKNRIGICGSHGKSTTTAMLAHIFKYANKKPTVFCGAKMNNYSSCEILGSEDFCIFEGCEYLNAFLHLSPTESIITNIDYDHPDFFKSAKDVISSFQEYAKLNEKIYINSDDKLSSSIKHGNIVTYGINNSADYTGKIIHSPKENKFSIYKNGELLVTCSLSFFGEHFVYDALGAFAAAYENGIDKSTIKDALSTFTGTGRRMELIKKTDTGVDVFEDYAHHPTEIKASLSALRKMGYGRICCIFQAHTYSRTYYLYEEFKNAFRCVDNLIIAPTFSAREVNTFGFTDEEFAQHCGGIFMSDYNKIADYVSELEVDAIVIMGAGDICKLKEYLK